MNYKQDNRISINTRVLCCDALSHVHKLPTVICLIEIHPTITIDLKLPQLMSETNSQDQRKLRRTIKLAQSMRKVM